ncbi:hypothetical protein MXD81_06395 [Microbacteriaceae bacterium K1510]|nr:hypothetical protein [Microbacteriaceae bacterium K1510]
MSFVSDGSAHQPPARLAYQGAEYWVTRRNSPVATMLMSIRMTISANRDAVARDQSHTKKKKRTGCLARARCRSIGRRFQRLYHRVAHGAGLH